MQKSYEADRLVTSATITSAVTTDAELLTASVGDSDAFAELYRRHRVAVLAYFARRTACPQTAADLTAETFAQAFSSRQRFNKTDVPARAWLFAIARRQLSRFVRSEKVSAKHRSRLGMATSVALGPADTERIEDLVDTDPQRRAVAIALRALPDLQREAVTLRVARQLSYATVAERLGCTEGAARVRVSRGLTTLADLLDADSQLETT